VLVLVVGRPDSACIDAPSRDPLRYEPLPGLAALPAWLWRRAGLGARIGAAAVVLAAIAVAVALAPALREASRERAEIAARDRAEQRAELVRRLEAEQRPRTGRSGAVAPAGAPPATRLAGRAQVMDELSAAITADARARVRRGEFSGPIRRVDCEAFPRSLARAGADEDLARRRGRYSCLAVTAEFERGRASLGGVIGHQYRALVDFESGRYAYCKVTGQSGPTREQLVTTPRACGG
jgi:hypothetical protein